MRILVLHRFKPSLGKYKEWLQSLQAEIVIFTDEKYQNDFEGYSKVVGFKYYSTSGQVEIEALKLFKSNPFERIIALDETDILRAARLREKLGISGQNIASATNFRNKIAMKVSLQNHVPCPAFKQLDSAIDLYEFVEQNGLPVVVKPIDGMGGVDTRVIRTEQDLEAIYEGIFDNLMVESFVEGSMYTIDGLVHNQELVFCSSSHYRSGCLAFQEEKGIAMQLLSREDAMFKRLRDFIIKVLAGLPTPDNTSFHCEVFHTKEDELVFCEIASRSGGAKIVDSIEHCYGINLDAAWTQISCGLELPGFSEQPARLTGVCLIPKITGKLVQTIEEFPFDWVISYQSKGVNGDYYHSGQSCTDVIGTLMYEGEDTIDLESKYNILNAYIEKNVMWERIDESIVKS